MIDELDTGLLDPDDPISDLWVALHSFWDRWDDLGRPAPFFEDQNLVLPATNVDAVLAQYRRWIEAARNDVSADDCARDDQP
jgi:hypothetical protein